MSNWLSTLKATLSESWFKILFLSSALLFWLVYRDGPLMHSFAISFGSILLETLPFLALGSIISGLMEVYVKSEWLEGLFPKKKWAPFAAGFGGIIFPVCECAIVPVARRLMKKGIPFTTVLAYLLAGPIVNPIVAASTAVAYNYSWSTVLIRLGFGYIIAVLGAFIIYRLFPGNEALIDTGKSKEVNEASDCHHADNSHHSQDVHHHEKHTHYTSRLDRFFDAIEHATADFMVIGQYLIFGAFLAGMAQSLIPRYVFIELGQTPTAGIGVMMFLAVLLNLCSEADAFVAASFRYALPLSAQMSFMLLGPIVDIKLIGLYLSFVRKKAVIWLVLILCLLVFTFSYLVEYLPQ
ncbi:MAG: permease [Verrucomicrobiota bacterium]